MTRCMETDKPLISILMAVYEPRMDWLEEQLISLNNQSYPNLRLYVRDDCSPTVAYEEIEATVGRCITAFPFQIQRNMQNVGSNATFEQLTCEAEGDYFAYCDQDDRWLAEKVETLVSAMTAEVTLVCSDVQVMDDTGAVVADSIQTLRKRHVFHSGSQLTGSLSIRNFVIGCTMLVRTQVAKEALPFPGCFVHDHWIALWGSLQGEVVSLSQPLIQYRQHQRNQTGVLFGIEDKQSYVQRKIALQAQQLQTLHQRLQAQGLGDVIERERNWTETRLKYHQWFRLTDGMKTMTYRPYGLPLALFELVLPMLPQAVFSVLLRRTKGSR